MPEQAAEGHLWWFALQLGRLEGRLLVAWARDRIASCRFGRVEARYWNELLDASGVLHDLWIDLRASGPGVDTALIGYLYAGSARGFVYYASIVLSYIGGGWGMVALAPMLAVARTRRFAAAAVATLAANAAVVFLAKGVVGRARPCACVPGIAALGFPAPTDGSFPSGHAAGSFAFAVFFATWCLATRPSSLAARALSTVGVALACGVALSRVALGVHFPSDAAAGALIGSVFGFTGARIGLAGRQRP